MKVRGEQLLPLGPEAAWNLLLNTEALARAMPGCESLVPVGPDEYEMRMKFSIASIQGLFAGKVRITDREPPYSYRLHVESQGKLGYVRGSGLIRLVPEEGGTRVTYEGDLQVSGLIASVGERMMDVTTRMMIARFFNSLAKQAAPS